MRAVGASEGIGGFVLQLFFHSKEITFGQDAVRIQYYQVFALAVEEELQHEAADAFGGDVYKRQRNSYQKSNMSPSRYTADALCLMLSKKLTSLRSWVRPCSMAREPR